MSNAQFTDAYEAFIRYTGTVSTADRPAQWGSLASLDQYRIPFQKTVEHIGGRRRVLDWGAGNGHFSSFLLLRNLDVSAYSFDGHPRFLEGNPGYRHIPATEADPVHISFADAEFEAVFSMGVLEHVHETGGDQRKSIAEIDRILKPGGLFLCFHLPNRFSLVEFVVRTLNRFAGTNLHAHSRRFDRRSFSALLNGVNWEIVDYGRYNVLPRNQLSRLPGGVSSRRWVVSILNFLDRALLSLFPIAAQNWYFIARKN